MGLFSRLRKTHNGTPAGSAVPGSLEKTPSGQDSGFFSSGSNKGIDSIYAFLQYDYESRGYNDALTNPDESYRNDNIRLIQHDLMILIDRTATYYETMLRETDFHISSRSRAGLIDLVEELKIRKEVTSDHLGKVRQIREEASKGDGASQRIVLSYQRGFMRGLYAISQSKLFNGNL
ncbi:MAG: hypothetical protein ACM3UT_04985 [Chloroflexota bacterium]